MNICSIKDCTNSVHVKNVCNAHYQRFIKNGSYELKHIHQKGKTCIADNCILPCYSKNLCIKHYSRFQRLGTFQITKNEKGMGHVNKKGYKIYTVNGIKITEHRLIMEKNIGRKLSQNEHVHHIDGNPSNNIIGNLVILSKGEHSRITRLGAKHTEKTKEIISLKKSGRKLTQEHKNNISLGVKKHFASII